MTLKLKEKLWDSKNELGRMDFFVTVAVYTAIISWMFIAGRPTAEKLLDRFAIRFPGKAQEVKL